MTEPTAQELFDMTGRSALITGASGHLGQSLARALAEAGACVMAASRHLEKAKAVADALPAPGGAEHRAVQIDHLDEESLNRGFDDAVGQAGQIDVLVNNGQQGHSLDWTNVTAEAFNRDLQNATGYFLLARRLRDHAVERGTQATVIMIGSMYGVVGSYPDAYEGIYTASPVQYHTLKGGIVQMTRHLAVYWAQDRIRVNCLSPGPFPSETIPQAMVENLKSKSPMRRTGSPHELKGPLLLLASDAGSYLTGQNLMVDGGWTAW
jgi:NAD(P)-dependent dehydrogenase (short-subunit alcohol dehydrogenase family)